MISRLFKGRNEDGERVWTPSRGRDGLKNPVPHAVLRKYEHCRLAMLAGKPADVARLQFIIAAAGYEVPTTVTKCERIAANLRKQT